MVLPLGLLVFTILVSRCGTKLTFPVQEIPSMKFPYGYTAQVLVDEATGIKNYSMDWEPSISANGRYVAFNAPVEYIDFEKKTGYSTNRAYVYDRKTGAVACASTMSNGTLVDGHDATISANGQYVVFASNSSPLTGTHSTRYTNIFVRDLTAQSTTLVSMAYNEQPADGSSARPSISADGRFVAFESDASNLVKGDTNESKDIFVYDLKTGRMQRASVNPDGAQSDRPSQGGVISASGRTVAFLSQTRNPGSNNPGYMDLWVYHLDTGRATRINLGQNFVAAFFTGLAINADGRYIAFTGGKITSDPNKLDGYGLYFYDQLNKKVDFLVKGLNGEPPDNIAEYPSISADGRYVAFESSAANLIRGGPKKVGEIYLLDRQTGKIQRVSVSSRNDPADDYSFTPNLSADGQHVVFGSLARNLVEGYVHGAIAVFIHDVSNWDDYPSVDTHRFSQATPFPGPYPPPTVIVQPIYPYPSP